MSFLVAFHCSIQYTVYFRLLECSKFHNRTCEKNERLRSVKKIEHLKAEHKAEINAVHERFNKQFNQCKTHYKTQMQEQKAQWKKQNELLESFKNVLEKSLG